MKTHFSALFGIVPVSIFATVVVVASAWAAAGTPTAPADTGPALSAEEQDTFADNALIQKAAAANPDAAAEPEDEGTEKDAKKEDDDDGFCDRFTELGKAKLEEQRNTCAREAREGGEVSATCKKALKCVPLDYISVKEEDSQQEEDTPHAARAEAGYVAPKNTTATNTASGGAKRFGGLVDNNGSEIEGLQTAVMRSGDTGIKAENALATSADFDRDLTIKTPIKEGLGYEVIDAKLNKNQAFVGGKIQEAERKLGQMGWNIDPEAKELAMVKSGMESSYGAATSSVTKSGRLDQGTFNHYSRGEIARVISKYGLPYSVDDVYNNPSIQAEFSLIQTTDLLRIADQKVAAAGTSYAALGVSRQQVAYCLNTNGIDRSVGACASQWKNPTRGRHDYVFNWRNNADDHYAIAAEALGMPINLAGMGNMNFSVNYPSGGGTFGGAQTSVGFPMPQDPRQVYYSWLMSQFGAPTGMPQTVNANNPYSTGYNQQVFPPQTGMLGGGPIPVIIVAEDGTVLENNAPRECGGQVITETNIEAGLLKGDCVDEVTKPKPSTTTVSSELIS